MKEKRVTAEIWEVSGVINQQYNEIKKNYSE